MTSGSYTLRCAFTVLLCFKLFHGASGDCAAPPVKENTKPVTVTSAKTGDTFIYTCDRSNDYYEIPNKSTIITCQADGTWTVIEDFCVRACAPPDRIPFAEPKVEALDSYPPNATVSYNCRPGFVRVPGSKNSITCLENYKWSTPEEFCSRRRCEYPGSLDNGDFTATDFLFGSRVTYHCNEGYRSLSRLNYRDCQSDGTWSNAVPQCDAVICPAPNKPTNGTYDPQKDEYTYLDSITFSCQPPSEVAGTATISCAGTGEWSDATPSCKVVRCSDPFVDHSSRKSGFIGPYKLHSAISFVCKEGFVLKGSSSITCNIDSQWDPPVPKCERASCGDPGTIENGQLEVSDFFVGSSVTYTCNKGYALTSSVNSRKCQESGIWTGSTPVCAGISCGDPGKIKNGHVRYSDTLYGSRAIYTCEEGYVRDSSEDYRECQADGMWSKPIACIEEHEEKRLDVWVIVVIVLVVVGAVIGILILCRVLIKKQKRGKFQANTPNVQYSSSTVHVPEERKKVLDVPE